MKTLKSLKQAKNISKNQLNAQDLINGQIYTSKGWESFKLSDNFKKELASLISETLGGWQNTKTRVFNAIYYGKPQHWGLSRLIVSKYKNYKDKRKNIYCIEYCAGQDYTYELNLIRTALK